MGFVEYFRCIWDNWWFPHALLLFVQVCFSGWHIIGSVVLNNGADPLVFALYREILASIIMYGFVISRLGYNYRIIIDKKDYLRFLFLGICSFMNVVISLLGLQYISADRYALLQPAIPVITTFISILLQIEKLTILKLIGILFAISGCIIIEVWNTDTHTTVQNESNPVLGTILVLIAAFGFSNLQIFQKPLLLFYDTSVITFIYYSIGSFITIIMCLLWYSRFYIESFYFNKQYLPFIALIYASLFASALNYNIYTYVSQVLSPSIVTIYTTFQPIATILLSFLIFQYIITLSQGIGGLCVSLGLIITIYGRYIEMNQNNNNNNDSLNNNLIYNLIETKDNLLIIENNNNSNNNNENNGMNEAISSQIYNIIPFHTLFVSFSETIIYKKTDKLNNNNNNNSQNNSNESNNRFINSNNNNNNAIHSPLNDSLIDESV